MRITSTLEGRYKVTHPVTSILHLLAMFLGFIFFGWKMALILLLLSVDVTVDR